MDCKNLPTYYPVETPAGLGVILQYKEGQWKNQNVQVLLAGQKTPRWFKEKHVNEIKKEEIFK